MRHADSGSWGDVRPAVSIPYEDGRATVQLVGVVRAVGVLAVVLGIVGLVFLPFQFRRWESLPYNVGRSGRSLSDWLQLFSVFAVLTLSLCLTVAGFGCLRPRPRFRRLLTFWGWASLAYAAYGVATTVYRYREVGLDPSLTLEYAAALGFQVRQWVSVSAFPLVAVVLTRHAAVRDVFR